MYSDMLNLHCDVDLTYACGICLLRPAVFQYEINGELHKHLGYVDPEGCCCRACAARLTAIAKHTVSVAA